MVIKKLAILTAILVALYLLFRNAQPYAVATENLTGWFARYWTALTKGEVKQ